jgi:hypothetical protein
VDAKFSAIGDLFTATKTVTTYQQYSKDDIRTYLSNPYRNSDKLRQLSDYFYYNNGIYKNVINAFSSLPTLSTMILPSVKTLGKVEDKAYGTYYDKVNNYIDSIDLKATTRNILSSVARYGGYVGYERSSGNEYVIQTLPIDYCRVKYKIGHDYVVEFNFKYFDKFFNKEDIETAWTIYPPEFKKLWNKYKGDKVSRAPEWQMLDVKKTYCILANEDEAFFIPMFCNMYLALLNNEEYQEIIKLGQQIDITKLIVQKIPTDKDGNITMPKELVEILHQSLKEILPEFANGLTTPLEIHDVPFSNQIQTKEELLSKAERGAFVSSGWSSALFADNSGHAGLQMNVEIVTASIYAILEKIESMFSRKFKNVVNSKNYDFKLHFYRTTNVNIKENFERLMKLVEIGGAITPVFSILGFDSDVYTTLLQIENNLGVKDNLQTPQSMHTQTVASGDSGRPPKDEKDLGDSGATTRDTGSNDNKTS